MYFVLFAVSAGRGRRGRTRANVKLILPNCQLSDLYFEMNSKRTRRLASQSGQYKRQFVANM